MLKFPNETKVGNFLGYVIIVLTVVAVIYDKIVDKNLVL